MTGNQSSGFGPQEVMLIPCSPRAAAMVIKTSIRFTARIPSLHRRFTFNVGPAGFLTRDAFMVVDCP
jgi:hypothetical protein